MSKLSAIQAELRKCEAELSKLTGLAPGIEPRKLIISTGDISDVDGFFALAQYAKTDADVLFIMNYPAYIGLPANVPKAECALGLGFTYSAIDYINESATLTHAHAARIRAAAQNPATDLKQMFTDLAFSISRKVWAEAKQRTQKEGKLYLCIGGINDINPFRIDICMNELMVFSPFVDGTTISDITEGTYIDANVNSHKGLEEFIYNYGSIHMDFNGSMAFLNSRWESLLLHCINDAKLKAVFVQGGVLSSEQPKTMPANPALNRLSCATMNQLYSPNKTAAFFELIKNTSVKIFVAPNNATEEVKGKWREFALANGISTPTLNQLGDLYYDTKKKKEKLFDFYTAMALTTAIETEGNTVFGTARLFYNAVYGISIIGDSDWRTVKESFKKSIPKGSHDAYAGEFGILDKVSCSHVDISVLKFNLLNDTLKLELCKDMSILIRGEPIPIFRKDKTPPTHKELEDITKMKAVQDWLNEFDFAKDAYRVTGIELHDIDYFTPERIGFLKFKLQVTNLRRPAAQPIPSIVFMRGSSVCMLVRVKNTTTGQFFSILTTQPRVAIGKQAFAELPAGMLDASDDFAGTAAKEIKEELELEQPIHRSELKDLMEAAGISFPRLYLSPGGCDEGMRFFLYQTEMADAKLKSIQGKTTGKLDEGETIVLKVVPFDDIATQCADAKTLTALYLYDRAVRRGQL